MNPIEAKGSAFVGQFVSALIVPGVSGTNRRSQTMSRLPRSSTNEAVVAARPGFVPRGTMRVGLPSGTDFGIEVVSYINCVIPDSLNCVRNSKPQVIRAP